jgi:acetyltransferase-like isoleucine patch superfamily enzyme
MTRGELRRRAHLAKRWVRQTGGAELRARWHLRDARAVGARPRVLGRPLITTPELVIGDDLLLWSHYRTTHLGGDASIAIGDRVFLNAGVVVLAFERITIEDDVALGPEVEVIDSDNHPLAGAPVRVAPVVIGRGSWIATRSLVLPGVRIGERAVVAAGSVVTSDVPDDTLVAGVPARPVRTLQYPAGCTTAWREPG